MSDAFLDRTQLDIVPAVLVYWDREARCRFANRAACEFFGQPMAELEGRTLRELMGSHYTGLDDDRVAAVLRGEPQRFDRELTIAGETRHADIRYTPHVVDGEVRGFNVIAVDITERRQAELALAERERQLREVQHIAGLGFWTWDLATNQRTWSDELFRIYGRDPARGAPSYEELAAYYTPEARAELAGLVTRARTTGQGYETTKCIHRHDGSTVWIQTVNEAVRDASGAIVSLRGTVLDVTARREAEQALNEAQRIAGVGSWQWNSATHTLTWSEEMYRLHGRDPAAGPPSQDELAIYSRTGHAQLLESSLRTLSTGVPFLIEQEVTRPDGRVVYLHCHGEALRNDDDEIVGVRGTMSDITARKQSEFAVARSEAALVDAQRIAGVGSWYWDVATGELSWSDEMYRICDRDRDRPPPSLEQLCEHYTPESHVSLVENVKRAFERGQAYSQESVLRRRDGSPVHVICRGEAVCDDRGAVIALRGTITDVTARKQTELALQESEAALREAQRIAATGSWRWDARADQWQWSGEMFRIYDRDPARGAPASAEIGDYYLPDAAAEVRAGLLHAVETGESFVHEGYIRRRDGSLTWCVAYAETIRDPSGAVIALQGTVTDGTARKQTELALQESEAALREAQRIAHVGSFYWEPTGRLTWSDEMFRIFDRDRSLGPATLEQGQQHFVPESYRALVEGVTRSLTTGEPYTQELSLRRNDGSLTWATIHAEAVPDASGKPHALRGTFTDITARKQNELALARSEADLREAQRIAQVGSFYFDPAAAHPVWSDEMYRIFDRDPARGEPTHAEMAEHFEPESHRVLMEQSAQSMATGESFVRDAVLCRRDGSRTYVTCRGEPVLDRDGRPCGLRGTVTDVTAQRRSDEALRQSEAALRDAQRIAHVGNWRFEIATGLLTWSEEMYRIFGRDPASGPLSIDAWSVFHTPEAHAKLRADIRRTLETGEPFSNELPATLSDGRTIWVRRSAEVMRNERGQVTGLRGTAADITERKESELALERTAAALREAQRISNSGSWHLDVGTGTVNWSDEMYRIFGRDPASGPPRLEDVARYHPPDAFTQVHRDVSRAIATGEPFQHELPLVRGDGHKVWIRRIGEVIRDERGAITTLRGTLTDITERKESELALARSEAALREAQRIAGVGSWRWELGSQTSVWSDEMYRIYGRDPALPPPSFDELASSYSPEDYAQFRADIARTLETGESYTHEMSFTRPDGRVVWIKRIGEALRDEQGAIVAIRGTTLDITERKEIELARARSEAALQEAQRIANVGSWNFDQTTGEITWSAEMYRIFDRDPARGAPTLQGLAEHYTEESHRAILTKVAHTAATGEPYMAESMLRRRDGSLTYVSCRGEALRDAAGRIYALHGTIADITPRKQIELALGRSETDLRIAQRIAKVGSWDYDVATGTSSWSEELFHIYGLDPATTPPALGEMEAFYTPETYGRLRADLQHAIDTGESYTHELPFRHPAGHTVWVKRIGEPRRDASGAVTGVRGTTIDITERKVAELALERSQAALVEAQRIAGVGSWEVDLLTGETSWSDEMYRIYDRDRTRNAPTHAELAEYLPPPIHDLLLQTVRETLATGEAGKSIEFPIRHRDGTTLWALGRGEPHFDAEGRLVGLRGTVTDITARKHAELALQAREADLRNAQRLARLGSWTWSRATNTVEWSDETYRIYGRDPALGPPTMDELAHVYSPDVYADLMTKMRRVAELGEPYQLETPVVIDGEQRWVFRQGMPVRDDEGNVIGAQGTALDITERKRAELALRASEHALREAQRIAGVGSWEWDVATGKTTMWTDEVYRIYERDPALGPPQLADLTAICSPETFRVIKEDLENIVVTGEPFAHEVELTLGSRKAWVKRSGEAVRDASGKIVTLRGTTMDITQRKLAELGLLAREADLREAQRMARVGSWQWLSATGATVWSDEMYRIFDRDPALGPPSIPEMAMYVESDEHQRLKEDLESALRGATYIREIKITRRDGTSVWLQRRGEALRDANGTVIGVHGTAMDITERKQREAALRASEQALRASERALLDAQRIARVGSWYHDRASGDALWSDEMFRIYRRDPALGPCSIAELGSYYAPDAFVEKLNDLESALAGTPYIRESRITRGDGTVGWVQRRGEPVRDEQGTIIGVRGTTMDITERKQSEQALRESEAALRDAQRIAHVGSWHWDRTTGKTTWSDEVFRIYGRDPALGEPSPTELEGFYDADAVRELQHDIEQALTGKPYLREKQLTRPDGVKVWVLVSGEPLRDETGAIIGVHGTSTDITMRKRAEVALKDSELALREAQRIARLGSWDWDIVAGTISWSDNMRGLLGWPIDEPIPEFEAQATIFTADSWTLLQEVVNEALLNGTRFDVELELMPRPGTRVRWVRSRCEVVQDSAGKTTGLHGILLDITESRVADAALRDSEARYALIARNTQDVIWLYDLEHERFEYVSPAIRNLLGLAIDEPLDLELVDMLPPAALSNALARGDSAPLPMYEMRMHRPDGIDVPVEVSLTLVRGDGDRVTHVQGTTRDMSNRKQLEQQVLQLQKMESVGRLAGGIAHDFNNLLTVIMGQLDFVLEEIPHDSDHAEALRDAMTAATRSAELTRQLLAFARQQKIQPRILDLNDEIDRGTAMLRRLVGENIDFAWIPGTGPWPVKLDPTQIHQLLANLIVNARDAITGHGRIEISTRNDTLDEAFCATHPGARPGSYVQLAVTDTGCGMTPEIRARVFEPFFTTKDPARGTGLGLSIVYGVVSQNHGYIDVESSPGAGTTFRLWFPRSEGDAPRAAKTGDVPRGNETLLVVEDERAVLALTRDMLKRLGYNVITASSPGEALATFATQGASVDLVLTDVVMPQMNGRELTAKLQELRPDVPCLYMSGYTADVATRSGDIDMDRLLQKPFTLPELARAIRQVLAQRPVTA